MTTVTVRLPDNILQKIDLNAHMLHISRSEYIKEAIVEKNDCIQEEELNKQLMRESLLTRAESMKVNREFAAIEYDPED